MRYCCGSIDLRGENFLPKEQAEIRYRIEEFFRGCVKLEENFNAHTLDIIIDDRDWPHPVKNGDYSLIALNRPHKSITVRLKSPSNYISRGVTAPPPPLNEWYGEAMRSPKKPVAPTPVAPTPVAPTPVAPTPVAPTRSKKLLLI